MAVPAEPEPLSAFQNGDLDLKSLFLSAPEGLWYLTLTPVSPTDHLALQPQEQPVDQCPYQPGPNLFLNRS